MLDLIFMLGSCFGGSALTLFGQKYFNRIQKMSCYYLDDDILSKIPQRDENGDMREKVHKKHFRLKNTTNNDIKNFSVVFQFDMSSTITDCYTRSKEGINYQGIKKNSRLANQADVSIKNFNRGDTIDFHITVANVTDNKYYVRESDSTGFKIICKDKREDTKKSKSPMSNTLLIEP